VLKQWHKDRFFRIRLAIREQVCKSKLSVQELENANLEANLPNWEFCELSWVLWGSNQFLLCLKGKR
jgi:hypothetical protein